MVRKISRCWEDLDKELMMPVLQLIDPELLNWAEEEGKGR